MGDFHIDSKALKATQKLAIQFVKTVLSNQDDFMWKIRKVVRAAYQVRFKTTPGVFKMLNDFGGQTASKMQDFETNEAAKE
ncbi:hypothetical protein BPOR_0557g00050 [Botrytis porri]|uniref:Uncharacterized protein n=2 Tax=Botrytis porri TaxID=87229 RepID=A0A4Z1KD46_9HELO|nr:hypothetical protein BPOR_0557g00050 [Botrytis porri]